MGVAVRAPRVATSEQTSLLTFEQPPVGRGKINKAPKVKRPAPLTWADAAWRWDGDVLVLTLPVVQSANAIWRSANGRVILSKKARLDKTGSQSALDDCPRIAGDVIITCTWYRAMRAGDLDNRCKALLDLLKNVAFDDDAKVARLEFERMDDGSAGRMVVRVCALPPASDSATVQT